MIKYAIVGNIASGKSTVEKLLSDKGFKVFDTDVSAHKILLSSQIVKEKFKSYDIFENGIISREKLGKLVFSNVKLKEELENIIHPEVKKEIEKFFETNKKEKSVFVSIPLLFEVNMEDMFDKILFIYTDDEIRLQRLIKRNNYTEEYAKIRMNSQIPQGKKLKKSDYVIYNNTTIEDLTDQLFKIIE